MDVVFAMDCSGSMGSTKLPNAKTAAIDFIQKIDDLPDPDSSKAGLVAWHNSVAFDVGLTSNFTYLKERVNTISAWGGTNLNQGLKGAIDVLDANPRPGSSSKAIIFLTDGVGTYTSCGTSGSRSSEAASKGYDIYSIRIGTANVKAQLEDMAHCTTNGKYFESPDSAHLNIAFNDIFQSVIESTVPHFLDVEITTASGIIPVTVKQLNIDNGNGLEAGNEVSLSFNATSPANDVPVFDLANSFVRYKDGSNVTSGEVNIPQMSVPQICKEGKTNLSLAVFIQ